jgi:AraC family transcriptional regulator
MNRTDHTRYQHQLALTSASLESWAGFPLEIHRGAGEGSWAGESFNHYWLALVLTGKVEVDIRYGSRQRHLVFTTGSISAYPVGQHWDHLTYRGWGDSINISFDWRAVGGIDANATSRTRLLSAVDRCGRDESLMMIAQCLAREIQAGAPSGSLYAEGLSMALAARIEGIANELDGRKAPDPGRFGLSMQKAQTVRAYIDAFLGEPLHSATLADLVHISPSHFAACFRATFGISVHQYVLKERIAKAKILLKSGEASAQVAAACGFSGQSHFTQAFRRWTGMTPAAFRRDCRRVLSTWTPEPAQPSLSR